MVRTEITLFLKNVPGELAKLTKMFSENKINIDAITIQDATSYVEELFKARGKALKRHATAASYSMIQEDSKQFALVRLLTSDTDKTMDLRLTIFTKSPRSWPSSLTTNPAPWRQPPKKSVMPVSTSAMSMARYLRLKVKLFSSSVLRTLILQPRFSRRKNSGNG